MKITKVAFFPTHRRDGWLSTSLILLLFIGASPEHLAEGSKTEDCGQESDSSNRKCKNPEPSCNGSEKTHKDSGNAENEP